MKSFNWLFITTFTLVGGILSSSLYAGSRPRNEVEMQDYGEDVNSDEVIWTGPGIYYGTWFDNEAEFNDWRKRHGYNNYRKARKYKNNSRENPGYRQ